MLELVAALENVEIRDVALLAAEWFHIKPGCLAHHQRKEKPMSGERPSHKAFVVEDRGEGQEADAFWTRVGSAWPHKDGKGLNVQIASGVPVSGRLVLREYSEEDATEDEKKSAFVRSRSVPGGPVIAM